MLARPKFVPAGLIKGTDLSFVSSAGAGGASVGVGMVVVVVVEVAGAVEDVVVEDVDVVTAVVELFVDFGLA
jgi:hypothetical protein